MWEYKATVIRWVDGDTLDATIDLGFYITMSQRLRLLASTGGVNTPEMHSKLATERALAIEALTRVDQLAPPGTLFTARTLKEATHDSFGRFLSQVVLFDGRSVGDVLLAEGLAVVWKG
jgi:micrococcal nuclease